MVIYCSLNILIVCKAFLIFRDYWRDLFFNTAMTGSMMPLSEPWSHTRSHIQLIQGLRSFKWMSPGPCVSTQIRCILGATRLGALDPSWLSLWKPQTCALCGPRGGQYPILQAAGQPLPSNAIARHLIPALSLMSHACLWGCQRAILLGDFLTNQQTIYVKSNNIVLSTEVTFSFW